MQAPSLNMGFDIVSHAHPLPVRPSPRALEEQRVRALVARQSIAVSLRGLSFERAASVSDVLIPKIRRSPINEEVTANHLDLTECWKGLSYTQATELTMWYQFFHKCLQDEVRTNLREDLVKGLLQSEEAIDEIYLLPRTLDYLRSKTQHVIDVSFVDLIDNMMKMFHDRFPNEAASVASNWSHFSGGLSLFLHNFLRVQDCFLNTADGPCIVVDFHFQYADSVLTATGDVTWQLPDVRFHNLHNRRSAGEEYRITPFILKDVLSPTSSPGCDNYVDQVDYTLPQSTLGFSWNPMKQCFKAIVPDYAHGKSHTLETVLKATIITPFPDDIKFERQSRWSIKLDITPAESHYKPSIIGTNRHDKYTGFHENRRVYRPLHDAFKDPMRVDLWSSDHGTVLRNVSEDRFDPTSPQKRKVSKPEVIDAFLDAKRRRRELADETENELRGKRIGDEKKRARLFDQASWWKANDTLADDDWSNAAQPGVDQCHACSSNKPSHILYPQPERSDSSTSSHDIEPSSSNNSAPNSAVETDHGALQQQQILRNYQEFSELKSRRDAGLISPVSDDERRAFEDIFLGDSEEWSPVTDGSAVELDTIMSETQ